MNFVKTVKKFIKRCQRINVQDFESNVLLNKMNIRDRWYDDRFFYVYLNHNFLRVVVSFGYTTAPVLLQTDTAASVLSDFPVARSNSNGFTSGQTCRKQMSLLSS